MSGQGNCTVVKAAPKLEILATNEFNEPTLSTPAISHGRLFLRTQGFVKSVDDFLAFGVEAGGGPQRPGASGDLEQAAAGGEGGDSAPPGLEWPISDGPSRR